MGFDWSHIARIDLLTGSVETVVDAAAFREKHDGRWVSDILSAEDDGQALLCRTGMGLRLPDGTPAAGMGYSLCRVTLATSEVQVIAPLRQTFF